MKAWVQPHVHVHRRSLKMNLKPVLESLIPRLHCICS